ncbi:MAG TPA: DNA polymerase III subunit gamma/tau [Steroidobacteraceae bacterium]|jgi:DNA polymerase-3 subunit gamma/tau|nr:DNA polymerase III subunit gamma/tau [Steroidobacteraceae bacterium]
MSYTALARKWRPKSFAEMSGQEHVLKALSNALDTGRVHHAFLFTGTRGVGKTTIARIFAKCLNCEKGVSAQPCGECSACRDIDAGRFVDLIEVDAASRTKVDDTRELLDNVLYAPSRGRYKIYLIDEVHMLSTHSFNALLKTLEEPPPHVKFLLATTDPQKLPVTVLSRCLQFNLKRLSRALITARLAQVLEAEGVSAEAPALRLLAVAADGSLRDALSLLDQLLAYGNGKVLEADARSMLGTVDRQHVAQLARLLAAQDAAGLLELAHTLEQWVPDYAQLLDELNSLLAQVAVLQVVPGSLELADSDTPELLQQLAAQIQPEDLQLYYQIGLLGRRDLPLAPEPRLGFAMTLVRMLAFRPTGGAPQTAGNAPGTGASAARSAAATRPVTAQPIPVQAAATAGQTIAAAASTVAPAGLTLTTENWAEVVAQLELTGVGRQLAANSVFVGRQAGLVQLALDPRHQSLLSRAQTDKLAQALSRLVGASLRVEIDVVTPAAATPALEQSRKVEEQLLAARTALESDPVVLALQERFGASLNPDSVRVTRS